jgi:tRNA U34 5-carboxymethylaminomethyl modifying GTPase MnmE/TrmE
MRKEKKRLRFRPGNDFYKKLEEMFEKSAQWNDEQTKELVNELSAKKQREDPESYIKNWLQRRRQQEVITVFLKGDLEKD